LRLEPAGLHFEPDALVPGRLPDLFAGAPLVILGRYRGTAGGSLALQARGPAGQEWFETVPAQPSGNSAIAAVWARGRVRELEDRYALGKGDPQQLEKQIVDTSLRFGVLCRFTAFIAVDRSQVVNPGGEQHKIVQPVEPPAGWAMLASCGTPAYMAPTQTLAAAMPEALGEAEDAMMCLREPDATAMFDADATWSGSVGTPPQSKALSLRRKSASSSPTPAPGQAAVDLTPYRLQALALWEELKRVPQGDTAARLTALSVLVGKLTALVKALQAAGAPAATVEPLAKLVRDLTGFSAGKDAGGPPASFWKRLRRLVRPAPTSTEEAVALLWEEAEQVLGAFSQSAGAGSASPPAPGAERREFWK
jgi:Ca-activated chloride channel family protein